MRPSLEPGEESCHCTGYLKFHTASTIWAKNAKNLRLPRKAPNWGRQHRRSAQLLLT